MGKLFITQPSKNQSYSIHSPLYREMNELNQIHDHWKGNKYVYV